MSTTTTMDVVARFCKQLAKRLGPTKFGLWFEKSATIQLQNDGSLRILVPSDFHMDWIEKQFRTEIDDLAGEMLADGARVSLLVSGSSHGVRSESPQRHTNGTTTPSRRGGSATKNGTRSSSIHNGLSTDNIEKANSSNRNGESKTSPAVEKQFRPVPAHAHLPVAMREFVTPTRTDPIAPPENWRQSNRNGSTQNGRPQRITPKNADAYFDPRYDFRHFIAGPGNDLAYHAAQRLAEGEHAFSPLAIHGGCGLGKTHLLRAICRAYAKNHPGARIRYVTGEDFTNEYITAVRFRKLDAFRNKIRRLDLLAIDDVHFLSNKNKTQTEFLCTLDAIGLTGAQLVLASDQHPKQIAQFQQRLVSRLVSGMVVEVRMPDRPTRLRIIKQLATLRGMQLNQPAREALADRCIGSVREIEGTLTRLSAMHDLLYGKNHSPSHDDEQQKEIGLILVNKVLETQTALPLRPIPVRKIVEEVGLRCGIPPEQITGSSRHKRVVLARSLSAYLARQLTTLSYPEIARALGKSNHSTIHAAVKRMNKLIETDQRVDFNTDERNVSIRFVIDTLRGAILTAGRKR